MDDRDAEFDRLVRKDVWNAFDTRIDRFLLPREAPLPPCYRRLCETAVSAKMTVSEVISRSKAALQRFHTNNLMESWGSRVDRKMCRLVLEIVLAMDAGNCDRRCARVAIDYLRDEIGCSSVPGLYGLDGFLSAAADYDAVKQGKEDTMDIDMFGKLAYRAALVESVYRHFAPITLPTRASVISRLPDVDGASFLCHVLQIWDKHPDQFPVNDPKFSFRPGDMSQARVWNEKAFIFKTEAVPAWNIIMERYSPEAPQTPYALVKNAVKRRGLLGCWWWPATVTMDPPDWERLNKQYRYIIPCETILIQWQVDRLTATQEIECALQNSLIAPLVCVVLSYFELDRIPTIAIDQHAAKLFSIEAKQIQQRLARIKLQPLRTPLATVEPVEPAQPVKC